MMSKKYKNKKMLIKKGDKVEVITGKHKGQRATIERVIPSKGRVVLAGLNMVKRHQKRSGDRPGGIIEKPASIDVSNVMIVCGACGLKTRIKVQIEGDKKLRICKKCGKQVD